MKILAPIALVLFGLFGLLLLVVGVAVRFGLWRTARVVGRTCQFMFGSLHGGPQRGSALARRPSSSRNALFLRAQIAAARGDWLTAEQHCRAAAGHPFRGQGGDGLLLWARVLEKLGRVAEARDALSLVSSRDPESAAARRLSEGAGAGLDHLV
jgi:hypothetical protein